MCKDFVYSYHRSTNHQSFSILVMFSTWKELVGPTIPISLLTLEFNNTNTFFLFDISKKYVSWLQLCLWMFVERVTNEYVRISPAFYKATDRLFALINSFYFCVLGNCELYFINFHSIYFPYVSSSWPDNTPPHLQLSTCV